MSAAGLPPENLYGHTKKLRFILERVEAFRRARGRPVRLLDFGCGNGTAVSRFLAGPGVRYHGVDVHPESLDHARRCFGSAEATFHDRVPEGVEFDVIVYADVLEHLADPAAVLREHAARLVADGLVLGAVPNGWGPFEMEHRLIRLPGVRHAIRLGGRLRRLGAPHPPPPADALPYNLASGHVQFFTLPALRRCLRSAGLEPAEVRNGAWVGAPISERFLLRGEAVARANARAADFLPHWMVSTWYFAAVPAPTRPARSP
ncbi:MAG TPA: class I SAM-dependent methyltransferase [Longimicrobiaceae bacterium]|nr:class I SAM-dependent methyltransferase [Longimicrobiaceae bacterium]